MPTHIARWRFRLFSRRYGKPGSRKIISPAVRGGLHRHNTLEELYWYLGKDIVDEFYPDRLFMHDGADPAVYSISHGRDGNAVTCSRAWPRLTSDCGRTRAGKSLRRIQRGYKMLITGLTSWKSIRSHHSPDTMHRRLHPVSTHSHMRRQFDSIGKR